MPGETSDPDLEVAPGDQPRRPTSRSIGLLHSAATDASTHEEKKRAKLGFVGGGAVWRMEDGGGGGGSVGALGACPHRLARLILYIIIETSEKK